MWGGDPVWGGDDVAYFIAADGFAVLLERAGSRHEADQYRAARDARRAAQQAAAKSPQQRTTQGAAMTNYLYQARVFPIGNPASVRGDRGQPVTFTFDRHDFSVSRRLASDIPVFVNHDPDLKIGNLRSLTPSRDWWVCCFELDEVLGIEFDVRQNVSVGLEWRLDDPGAPRLGELSIVRHGRVPGAEIMHRVPAPPAARQARPAVQPTAVRTLPEIS